MLYKAILKPVWTYGIQLWGTASNSNMETLQRFQWKTLRFLIDVPWYVTNETIHRELKIPTVKEEISKFSNRYNIRINNHQNPLVTQLLDTTDQIRTLKSHYPVTCTSIFKYLRVSIRGRHFFFFYLEEFYNQFSLRIISKLF